MAQPYGTAADIYSFGLIAWEIYEAKRPYPRGWSLPELLSHVAHNNERPAISEKVPCDLCCALTRESVYVCVMCVYELLCLCLWCEATADLLLRSCHQRLRC